MGFADTTVTIDVEVVPDLEDLLLNNNAAAAADDLIAVQIELPVWVLADACMHASRVCVRCTAGHVGCKQLACG